MYIPLQDMKRENNYLTWVWAEETSKPLGIKSAAAAEKDKKMNTTQNSYSGKGDKQEASRPADKALLVCDKLLLLRTSLITDNTPCLSALPP